MSSDRYPSGCPSRAELADFNAGRMSEAELVTIAEHLATCRPCETILESLESGDYAVFAAVAAAQCQEAMDRDPVFQELLARGRALPIPPDAFTAGEYRLNAPETETWIPQESDQALRPAAKLEELLPEKVGDYFVNRKLGAGGFGVVYLATDPKTGLKVAVKVPKAGPNTTEAVIQEFLREARLVSGLEHPRIVKPRDFSRVAEFGCYVVLPYFKGGSLAERLKRGRLDYVDAARMLADVAEALHEAHQSKIYHRDIKPANILLDDADDAYLTDFGLALQDDERWLHRDELAGTRAYMSPEQVVRQVQFIDSRTDIWSLGVILYEMLTRECPFRGRTQEQLFQEIQHKRANPRVVDAQIPVALERICTKCLERDPNSRYTTTLDLAFALREWADRQAAPKPPGAVASPPATADGARPLPKSPAPAAADVRRAAPAIRGRSRLRRRVLVAAGLVVAIAVGLIISGHREPEGMPLLDREPVMFSWEPGDGCEAPRFDASAQRYSVRSDRTHWIATVRESDSRPMKLRANISVQNWVGFAGLVWGLRPDPDAGPEKRYRCLVVAYQRISAAEPARLAVSEVFLTERSFGDVQITHQRRLAEQEIGAPRAQQAQLEVAIEPQRLRVRFDQQDEWQLEENSAPKTDWLPHGRAAIGLTGQGRNVAILGLSLRFLPLIKEP